jgi:class 3 adenylate cyclase
LAPETKYAYSGDTAIAYQVVGEGPRDIVVAFPYISHLDLAWESPFVSAFLNRLKGMGRLILFDRRGVGLSDPVAGAPTLDERIDDLRAVMDAAGSERAVLFGMSEGAAMCLLFAASFPERAEALLLWGAMARSTEAEDYPFAPPREALLESQRELIMPLWGTGVTLDIFVPSFASNPNAREGMARLERQSASPRRIQQLVEMFLDLDVRDVLPTIQVPTLVMQRRHDRIVNAQAGRWLAEQIPGSEYREFEGIDHLPWELDTRDAVLDEMEEFLTGARPAPTYERVLATVMFTDIVDSTLRAGSEGDTAWRALLGDQQALVRENLKRFDGREVDTTGDGFLATFASPTRAIECAAAITRSAPTIGLEIRAGLHSGEIEVLGANVAGIAVHLAARICATAGAREIHVSRTVHDLVAGSQFEFSDCGDYELKGFDEPWRLYAVERTPLDNVASH